MIMKKASTVLTVGICGAPSTGKTSLLQCITDKVSSSLGTSLLPIVGCATTVSRRSTYLLDSAGTIETQFAIDAEQFTREGSFEDPFITCRTVVDALAYAKANELSLDHYYESLLSRVNRLSVLLYVPIEPFVPFIPSESRDLEYQFSVDAAIRSILKRYRIPVQIVTGTLDQRTQLAVEAIRLRI